MRVLFRVLTVPSVLVLLLFGLGRPPGLAPGRITDLGAITVADTERSTTYQSNRDVGQSIRLSGVNAAGQAVTRDLWVFGDSDGWNATTGAHLTQYFPSNTASLVPPTTTRPAQTKPAVPDLPAMPAEFVRDEAGHPTRFAEFITGGNRPGCGNGYYSARWPSGVARLPDSDPRFETALVFYQDFCVRFSPLDYQLGSGGVARLTWDASSPDAYPHATPLTEDPLFWPGSWHNYTWGTDGNPGYTPGAGVWLAGATADDRPSTRRYLMTLACGPASDCVSLRVLVDGVDLAGSLARVADRTSWSYRTEGATKADTDDTWRALPDSGCTPSPYLACGNVPKAKPVIKAGRDRLSQVWGTPAVSLVGGQLLVTYFAAPNNGLFATDVTVRKADPRTGVFGPARQGMLPAGHCASGCYAPAIHPELSVGSRIAFSYVATADQQVGPDRTKLSTLRLAWTCTATFDTGRPC
jgi:hypothetical protein